MSTKLDASLKTIAQWIVCAYSPAARVPVPITPSTLLIFIVKFVLYFSCEKNQNKQKEVGFVTFKKEDSRMIIMPTFYF